MFAAGQARVPGGPQARGRAGEALADSCGKTVLEGQNGSFGLWHGLRSVPGVMIKSAILSSLACLGLALSSNAQVRVGTFGDQACATVAVGARATGAGYWETIRERVWVPGHYDEVVIPARYGWTVDRCGHRVWGLISPERCERIWHPGGWEIQERRVWVPDCRAPRARVVVPDRRRHLDRPIRGRGPVARRGAPSTKVVSSPAQNRGRATVRSRPVLGGRRR